MPALEQASAALAMLAASSMRIRISWRYILVVISTVGTSMCSASWRHHARSHRRRLPVRGSCPGLILHLTAAKQARRAHFSSKILDRPTVGKSRRFSPYDASALAANEQDQPQSPRRQREIRRHRCAARPPHIWRRTTGAFLAAWRHPAGSDRPSCEPRSSARKRRSAQVNEPICLCRAHGEPCARQPDPATGLSQIRI